jgi:GT2 family glycosyltransferase
VTPTPAIATIVVSWRSRDELAKLLPALPRESWHEVVVVDNGGDLDAATIEASGARLIRPERNLGFAGGCNAGARASRAPLLLFLNPDARPLGDALGSLRDGFDRYPEAAGLVPRLVGLDGRSQCRWQLSPLPGPWSLLAHAFFWNPAAGPRREPAPGTPIAQPAAAALALRRETFEAVGGFDEAYLPAWFEDVDLALRLAQAGRSLLYWPAATFEHRIGSTVPALGYGRFLAIYDRNLARYLSRHHGRAWEIAFRALVPVGALLRIVALPLRRPRRAASRGEAARALWAVARGAVDGWSTAAELAA